jgi:hypothetical protein
MNIKMPIQIELKFNLFFVYMVRKVWMLTFEEVKELVRIRHYRDKDIMKTHTMS